MLGCQLNAKYLLYVTRASLRYQIIGEFLFILRIY